MQDKSEYQYLFQIFGRIIKISSNIEEHANSIFIGEEK
jgi:hypothetical protein